MLEVIVKRSSRVRRLRHGHLFQRTVQGRLLKIRTIRMSKTNSKGPAARVTCRILEYKKDVTAQEGLKGREVTGLVPTVHCECNWAFTMVLRSTDKMDTRPGSYHPSYSVAATGGHKFEPRLGNSAT